MYLNHGVTTLWTFQQDHYFNVLRLNSLSQILANKIPILLL